MGGEKGFGERSGMGYLRGGVSWSV